MASHDESLAEEVNQSGGVQVATCNKKVPIKIVVYDDQSVPATAVSLYEKMATVDNVDFFVGPDWTSMGEPHSAGRREHKDPDGCREHRHAGALRPWPETCGALRFRSYALVERYFDMLSKVNPKPQSIFFVTHDNPVMKGITGFWTKKAEAQGMKVVGNETFSPDLKDFTAMIAKMRAARADIIYLGAYDGASVPLIQQMRQLKSKGDGRPSHHLDGLALPASGTGHRGMTGSSHGIPE